MTNNNTAATTEVRLTFGQKPLSFWVNSMGEFGHTWPDGGETFGGSINLKEATEAAGLEWKHPYEVPESVIQREHARVFRSESVDSREHVLYQLWEHLQPLQSSLWRFYGGIVYEPGQHHEVGPWMELVTEYVLNDQDAQRLRELASAFGAKVEEMFEEEPGTMQYEVNFPILGKSFGEIASLQLAWMAQAESFNDSLVNVL